MIFKRKCEFLVVGSGAGGATLARELSKRGRDVLVVERGARGQKIGTVPRAYGFYDKRKLSLMPRKSDEGVIIWRSFMAGGTTVVSCANGPRSLEDDLRELGIDLDEEFGELEDEIGIAPVPENLVGPASRRIGQAAEELGYQMQRMPKFIDPAKCTGCGRCVLGCVHGAKWSALQYLREAEQQGAEVVCGTTVREVVTENGRAVGVKAVGPKGRTEIRADAVILAAGGLATPAILQRSGIGDAGEGLFVDLFVNTYAVAPGLDQTREPVMTLVDLEFHDDRGFLLSPFINQWRLVRFMEAGLKGARASTSGLVGIMTKIADEPVGRVLPDGRISRPVTERDSTRLLEGSSIAKEILAEAGADARSFVVTRPQGAHPGGTAAIGRIVNPNLRTEVDNLFVCDASVLPNAPGLPPIPTIVALAKRLAKTLA